MNKVPNLTCSSVVALACALMSITTVVGQHDSQLFGSWRTKGSPVVIRLTLNPDGTGYLDANADQVHSARVSVDRE